MLIGSNPMEAQPHRLGISRVMKHLLFSPTPMIRAYTEGSLKNSEVFLLSFIFLFLASFLFAITTVIHTSPGLQMSQWQFIIRFFFTFGLMFLFLIPLATGLWSMLQKFSSWYLNLDIPFIKVLGISGLGIFYYALIFLASIPVFLMRPVSPYVSEGILFFLNLSAFLLSIRLFGQTYRLVGGFSVKKAYFTALFPLFLLVILYVGIQTLTYFAILPRMGGHH
jgi:hypothetical protein